MQKIVQNTACNCTFRNMTSWPLLSHPSIHPSVPFTGPPLVFLQNKSHQTHYRWPRDSIYPHLSVGPSQWGDPTAVASDTGTVVWVSWPTRSHCLSNPSTGKTWAPAGPVGMMSSARRHGRAAPNETSLHVSMRQQRLEIDSEREVKGQSFCWWQSV